MDNNLLSVVEYSAEQDSFHVETIEEMLSTNKEVVLAKGQQITFVPIAFFYTKWMADDFIDQWRAEHTAKRKRRA